MTRWFYYGNPCPLCEWAEPHLHSELPNGKPSIVVRRLLPDDAPPSEAP